MSKLFTYTLLAVAMTSGIACGEMDQAASADEATSGLDLSAFAPLMLDDSGFDCLNLGSNLTVPWGPIHCCPFGMAMIGARLDRNVYKCSNIERGLVAPPHLDGGLSSTFDPTITHTPDRNSMHSCPPGEVMVGYRQHIPSTFWIAGSGRPEILVCARPSQGLQQSTEYVDGGTQDGAMHVCQGWTRTGNTLPTSVRYAMTGIHAGANRFNCTR